MKDRLKHFALFYIDSWCLSAFIYGVLCLVGSFAALLTAWFVILYERSHGALPEPGAGLAFLLETLLYLYLGLLVMAGVGCIATIIRHLIKCRWQKALGAFLVANAFIFFANVLDFVFTLSIEVGKNHP